jgi:CheY-like chemotaxis protein
MRAHSGEAILTRMPVPDLTPIHLRVLIVDSHEVTRAAIRALLQTEGLEVVADIETSSAVVALARELEPDLAIVDIGPGDPDALELTHSLSSLSPAPTVVLVSSSAVDVDLDGWAFLAKADVCAKELRRIRSQDCEHQ